MTKDGVVIYGADRTQGKAYTSMLAPYIADTWQVTDKLRLEGGVRYERYRYRAWSMLRTTGNLGMTDTLADDAARLFTGARAHTALDVGVTNWTAGFNYDINPTVGIYGRTSRAHRAPSEGANEGNVNIPTADQFELGTKLNFDTLDVFATAFYT
ncbi:TonB-dependent receptor [Xanthomonas hortorum pv. vitians]|nr:TonB-dependent receptor [Xanthomonas hortorum]MCE4307233.1 TonB-dependent receptor [Xanthomonas hortorum pv. vitians]MCE4312459.1 TonB-dependent receptor [Xanthomonas hortorum pv. vitians]MCE4337903.1 TonB-dependent receptor [Xanthomonas hortorum pv. vitians]MCE4342926.1 TonB-dependent receptor [Xanthomonas hortorum pv. vitians]MCE4506043.1 TonB-dependent receptor [Xanthomonas hortorum pv. vitians]